MGKWATVNLPEGFEKRLEEMKHLTDDQIHDLWIKNGSLSLGDFSNMGWYWSSLNGWACIDNCEGKDAPAMLKVFCKYQDHVNDEKRINFEKLCVCLAVEFHAPREATVISAIPVTPEEKPVVKPFGYNLNMLVEGSHDRPSLQLHVFNGRYDPVIAFLCSNEEHAERIIDAFTGGDGDHEDVVTYFNNAPWFPIVYANNAVAAIEAMLDHTNKPFVEKDIRQWAKAVERAAGEFLYVEKVPSLPADMDAYMEGW